MHHDAFWYKIIGSISAGIIGSMVYIYSTFETKAHSEEILSHIIRIEQKLDEVILDHIK